MTRAASTGCRIGIQPEVQLINILGGVGGEDRVPAKPGTKVRDLHTRIFLNEMCASLYSTELLFEFGARLLKNVVGGDEMLLKHSCFGVRSIMDLGVTFVI